MDLMEMLQSFFINILPVLSIVYLSVGIRYVKHKHSGRINYFSLFMFACAVYTFGYYLEIQTINLAWMPWVRGFEFLGVAALPGLGIVYIAEYTLSQCIPRKYPIWLAGLSATLWVSYVTNPLHHLFYLSIEFNQGEFGTIVQTVKGPFYYLVLVYYCCFVLLAAYFLASAIFHVQPPDKATDKKRLLAGLLVSIVPLILILGGYDSLLDPVPFAMILMNTVFLSNEIVNQIQIRSTTAKEYEELIAQMQQGLAVHEIICDQFGKPIDYRFLSVNDSFEKLTGLNRMDIIGKTVMEVLPNTEQYWIQVYGEVALTGKPYRYTNYSSDLDRYYDVYAYSPKPRHFAVLFSDITMYRTMEHNLFLEKEMFRTTVMSVADGIISTDANGNVVVMNEKAESLTGYRQEAAEGKSLEQVFYLVDSISRERWLNPAEPVYANQRTVHFDSQKILMSHSGSEIPVEGTISPILNETGKTDGAVVIFRDYTERKKKQDEILYLSYHDQLTGLYNRRFFEEELKRLDTERNLPMTLVIFDVNGLKLINDAFGHQTADQVLQTVAWALRRECRSDDIIARIGGDEFVLLLPQTEWDMAETISNRIQQSIKSEKVQSIQLSVSFGWETKRQPEMEMTEVFKNAENNMYVHKLVESATTRHSIVDVIRRTLNEKNDAEEEHAKRVSRLSASLAERMKLQEKQVDEVRTIGLMHDIGKIAVRDETLNKDTPLTQPEWTEIKRHSEIGYKILSASQEYLQIAEHVLHQHERWDGTGYPKGLRGVEISIQSRILAVADAYDAMTSPRTYGKIMSHQEALAELRRFSGIQFDPAVVAAFGTLDLEEEIRGKGQL
jgi:diguanylate cyclase (GGDEF)-like protein/PAS domain S-box-containing protein/putative nucleotidyltransferase with HDIG domain